jgi:hypothetical protein
MKQYASGKHWHLVFVQPAIILMSSGLTKGSFAHTCLPSFNAQRQGSAFRYCDSLQACQALYFNHSMGRSTNTARSQNESSHSPSSPQSESASRGRQRLADRVSAHNAVPANQNIARADHWSHQPRLLCFRLGSGAPVALHFESVFSNDGD